MAFKNPLLDKLLRGVLEKRPIAIKTDLTPEERIQEALNLLPVSLSENQRAAILNAWRSEISYIQGPPGTGKSHTITAIMLSALFLKQRVLMVSHKKPAVEIVRKQVDNFLGSRSVVYLGPLSEQRRDLRGHLERLCEGT
jgi:DNA replication protein DnaC